MARCTVATSTCSTRPRPAPAGPTATRRPRRASTSRRAGSASPSSGSTSHQDIAGLVRSGYEVEAGYRIPLNGLFAVGDQPWFNWIQPAVRISRIENDFSAPAAMLAKSFAWDWTKLDIGFRVGIVRNVDLTVEYARHDMRTKAQVFHPDELLVTLRAGF